MALAIPGWVEDLEATSRAFAEIRSLMAIQGQDDAAQRREGRLWRLARTSICLHEAAAAATARGNMILPEAIAVYQAQGFTADNRKSVGAALYRLCLFVTACDPAYALSNRGLMEITERCRDPQPVPIKGDDAEDLIETAGPGRAPIIHAVAKLRHRWIVAPKDERAQVTAARILIAPELAFAGATRGFRLFLGNTLDIATQRHLSEAAKDPGTWLAAFLPVLSEASQQTLSMIKEIAALDRRLIDKLGGRLMQDTAKAIAYETIYRKPVFSTADLAAACKNAGRAMTPRGVTKLVREFLDADVIKPNSPTKRNRLWVARDRVLLGEFR